MPAQIRNRTGFLDSIDRPFIALETIQGWLDTQAPPPQSEARPSTASISDQPKPVLMATMPHEAWPAGSVPPAGSIVRYRTGIKGGRRESVVSKSFNVLLNCLCFLMQAQGQATVFKFRWWPKRP